MKKLLFDGILRIIWWNFEHYGILRIYILVFEFLIFRNRGTGTEVHRQGLGTLRQDLEPLLRAIIITVIITIKDRDLRLKQIAPFQDWVKKDRPSLRTGDAMSVPRDWDSIRVLMIHALRWMIITRMFR